MSATIERRAVKQHTCVHCLEDIDPGTVYAYAKITPWDHDENEGYGVYKAHRECHAHWEAVVGEQCDWMFDVCAGREFKESMATAVDI